VRESDPTLLEAVVEHSGLPADGELVRTSGTCCRCDSRFVDELVVRVPSRALPGGFPYIELRHLSQRAALELRSR
jgi:hypothetical protein